MIYIPESLALEKMLIRLRTEQIQMAIVIDEYGGTAGLVTIEDLVEEVVGEIQDEFDQEIMLIEELPSGSLRVRGDLLLDELNQLYDLDVQHANADTVGGLVMVLLGRIPNPGDRVDYGEITIEVKEVDGLAVQTVVVHRVAEAGD